MGHEMRDLRMQQYSDPSLSSFSENHQAMIVHVHLSSFCASIRKRDEGDSSDILLRFCATEAANI